MRKIVLIILGSLIIILSLILLGCYIFFWPVKKEETDELPTDYKWKIGYSTGYAGDLSYDLYILKNYNVVVVEDSSNIWSDEPNNTKQYIKASFSLVDKIMIRKTVKKYMNGKTEVTLYGGDIEQIDSTSPFNSVFINDYGFDYNVFSGIINQEEWYFFMNKYMYLKWYGIFIIIILIAGLYFYKIKKKKAN